MALVQHLLDSGKAQIKSTITTAYPQVLQSVRNTKRSDSKWPFDLAGGLAKGHRLVVYVFCMAIMK